MTTVDPEARFRRAAVAAVLVLSLVKMVLHEPWRDEWGPWGAAIASGSFAEVVRDQRDGGHPILWQALVFAFHRVFGSFVAVQVFHALVATATAYVVLRWAPFPRWVRALALLGYFPFYEYGVVVRPYGIALLATCAACALYVARPRNPLALAAALAVLVNTTAYGWFVAFGIAAAWTLDAVLARRRGDERPRAVPTVLAAAMLAAALALALAHMVPSSDTGFAAAWHLEPDLHRAADSLRVVARALVPVPGTPVRDWGTSVVDHLGVLLPVTGGALLLGIALLNLRRWPALLLWTAATGAILAFTYAKLPGALRHHGHVFLAYLAASWIAAAADVREGPSAGRARRRFLVAVLVVQAVAGLLVAGTDAVTTFSSASAAAGFLRRKGLDRLPMVGERDTAAAAVAAALGRSIHFPASGRTSTFVMWDLARLGSVTDDDVLAAADRLRPPGGGDVVLVLSRSLTAPPDGVRLVQRFGRCMVPSERFRIYVDGRAPR